MYNLLKAILVMQTLCSVAYSSDKEKTDESHVENSLSTAGRALLSSRFTEREETSEFSHLPFLYSSTRENDENSIRRFLQEAQRPTYMNSSQFEYSSPILVAAAGGPPPWPRIGLSLLLRDGNLRTIDEYMHRPFPRFLEDLFNSRAFRMETYIWNGLNLSINGILGSFRVMYIPTPATPSDSQPVDPSTIDQEALTRKREQIRDNYIKMATEGESADRITMLLPAPETIDTLFAECIEDLTEFFNFWEDQKISDSSKFRIINAKRTLRLISGDGAIEHHSISSVDSYSTFSYPGLPNVRQLLILAWRLAKPDTKDFVEAMIAENWNTPAKWRQWQQLFLQSPFASIVAYDDAGQSLRADREKGRPLVRSIAHVLKGGDTLPVAGSQRVILQFMKRFLLKRTEQIVPLVEALSMVMRGHNIELQNDREPNRPACAEGAYLGILKSIGEMVSYTGDSFFHITIDDCGSERLPVLPQLNLAANLHTLNLETLLNPVESNEEN